MARILLLDKANVIDRLQRQLTALGHEVIAADTDAYAALVHVKSANAELMMIDLNLPGGGAQLIIRLHAEPTTARTPIIALFEGNWTGVAQDSLTRLLQKPTDTDTLKCVLDELLPRQPPPKEPAAANPETAEDVLPPSHSYAPAPMDMGAPSDDDLPPGEILEL